MLFRTIGVTGEKVMLSEEEKPTEFQREALQSLVTDKGRRSIIVTVVALVIICVAIAFLRSYVDLGGIIGLALFVTSIVWLDFGILRFRIRKGFFGNNRREVEEPLTHLQRSSRR